MSVHLITGYAGKEHITSADQGSFNAAIMGGGEFVMERGEQFRCQVISNNQVRIYDGDALMQGRHILIDRNTYVETTHDNGTQGYKRIDLIVLTYEKNAVTSIETVKLEVIKGTPAVSDPSVPEYTTGDILNSGEAKNQMPLYKIPFDGLSIGTPVKLFSTVPTLEGMKKDVDKKVENKINELDDSFSELEAGIDGRFDNAGKPLVSNIEDMKLLKNYGEYSADAKSVGEIAKSFQDGCNTIVSGVTAQGVTPKSNSPADIVTAINTVATNKYNAGVTATKVGTAAPGQVLKGKTFTNSSTVGATGTMPNNGAVTGSITTSGGSYTIPAGYHNGSGKVTGPTLASLVGTNVTLDGGGKVLEGYTAYGKGGTKYTGSMAHKGNITQDAIPTSDASNIYLAIPVSGYYNTSSKLKCKGINHMSFNNGLTAQTGNQTITHSREWTAEMTGRLVISMLYTSFAGIANTQGTCSCTVDGAAQTPTRDSGSGWDRVVVYSMYVTKGQKVVCTGTLPETGNATHSVGQSWNMCYVS